VIVFVPAGHELFGAMDQSVGHMRRYEKEELIAKLREGGVEIEDAGYQNRIAKAAWWVNSKLLKRRGLPLAQSRIFDRFVPLIRALEGDSPASGLSLAAVGRKSAGALRSAA